MTILEIAKLKVNLDRLKYLRDKYGLEEDYTFLKILDSIERMHNKYDKKQRAIINQYKNNK